MLQTCFHRFPWDAGLLGEEKKDQQDQKLGAGTYDMKADVQRMYVHMYRIFLHSYRQYFDVFD